MDVEIAMLFVLLLVIAQQSALAKVSSCICVVSSIHVEQKNDKSATGTLLVRVGPKTVAPRRNCFLQHVLICSCQFAP